MNINKDLERELKKCNKSFCEKGLSGLKEAHTIPKAIEYFFANIDYCFNNNFPTKEYFAKLENIQRYGVYVDELVNSKNQKNIVTFGNCAGEIEYSDYWAACLYVRHNSKLTIKASGHAFVMIDIFDNAEIEVLTKDSATIKIHRYGGTVISVLDSEHPNSSITITRKNSKKY
jgi:hypothetical protein